MKSRIMFLSAGLFLVSGCAWTAQQVNLKPSVTVTEASLGHSQTVYVEVENERPRNAFGTKIPQGGGDITPVQDPKVVVTEALVLGMTRLGFNPVLAQSGGSAKPGQSFVRSTTRSTWASWPGA